MAQSKELKAFLIYFAFVIFSMFFFGFIFGLVGIKFDYQDGVIAVLGINFIKREYLS